MSLNGSEICEKRFVPMTERRVSQTVSISTSETVRAAERWSARPTVRSLSETGRDSGAPCDVL